MTSFITSVWNRFCSKQVPFTVMVVGLDNSGKTSLLTHIKLASFSSRQTSSSPNSIKSRESKSHPAPDEDALRPVDDEEPLFMQAGELTPAIQQAGQQPLSSGNQRENVAPTIGYSYDRIQYKGNTINVLDFSGQSKYRGLWEEFYNCVDGIVFVLDSSDLIRLVVARDELENILSHPYFSSLQATTTTTTSQSKSTKAAASDNRLCFQVAQKQLVISQGKLLQSPLEGDADGFKSTREQAAASLVSGPKSGQRRSVRRRTRVPILFVANKADLTNAADTELIARTLNLAELSASRHPWHIQAMSVQTSQGIQEGFDWLVEELLAPQVASGAGGS